MNPLARRLDRMDHGKSRNTAVVLIPLGMADGELRAAIRVLGLKSRFPADVMVIESREHVRSEKVFDGDLSSLLAEVSQHTRRIGVST